MPSGLVATPSVSMQPPSKMRSSLAPDATTLASPVGDHKTAIFRQVNKDKLTVHHDALEFSDGRTVLLTLLCEGQAATVLQLPARPMTAAEADAQKRVTYVG